MVAFFKVAVNKVCFWIREIKLGFLNHLHVKSYTSQYLLQPHSWMKPLHYSLVTQFSGYPVLICASQRVLFMVTQDLEIYSKLQWFDSRLLRLYVGESLCKILHPKIKAHAFHNVNLC